MKKLLLSGGVLGLFFLYGWHQKQEAAGIRIVAPSGNTTQQSSSSDPNSGTSGNTPSSGSSSTSQGGAYKDGTYTGSVADAFYGNIQVQVTINGGKISNVQFLQAPNDRGTSVMINQQADPMLAQEAISAQSANVDIVSGATDSSQAFIQSMQSALAQAKS